jgi:hypothetical protein
VLYASLLVPADNGSGAGERLEFTLDNGILIALAPSPSDRPSVDDAPTDGKKIPEMPESTYARLLQTRKRDSRIGVLKRIVNKGPVLPRPDAARSHTAQACNPVLTALLCFRVA